MAFSVRIVIDVDDEDRIECSVCVVRICDLCSAAARAVDYHCRNVGYLQRLVVLVPRRHVG